MGEPTKTSYEAPAGDNTSERGEVCVYPSWAVSMPLCIRPARVGCLQKKFGCKRVSQHRHRSFRLVIASLQIGPTAQRRAQLKHLETTLRTPPVHTHTGCGRTDKDKLRGASRRHHKRQTRGVCCLLYTSPSPRDLSTSRMPSSA